MHEVGTDRRSLALSEICAVGRGGSFTGPADHTREHGREFWSPALFERGGYESWQAEGATTLKERVEARSEALRTSHRPSRSTRPPVARTAEIINAARARSHD